MEPKKYRKKPVVIEAMQLIGDNAQTHAVYKWVEDNTLGSFDCTPVLNGEEGARWPKSGISINPADGRFLIATLEGVMQARPGDYIIRGVQGEFYPCKPDIFEATYEATQDSAPLVHRVELSEGEEGSPITRNVAAIETARITITRTLLDDGDDVLDTRFDGDAEHALTALGMLAMASDEVLHPPQEDGALRGES